MVAWHSTHVQSSPPALGAPPCEDPSQKNEREKFHKLIETLYKDEFDKDRVYEIVQTNYNMMNSK